MNDSLRRAADEHASQSSSSMGSKNDQIRLSLASSLNDFTVNILVLDRNGRIHARYTGLAITTAVAEASSVLDNCSPRRESKNDKRKRPSGCGELWFNGGPARPGRVGA